MLSLSAIAALSSPAADLARPLTQSHGLQLSTSPSIWLTHDFLSSEVVRHMRSKVPTNESEYTPCIGQIDDFDSKRCTLLPVKGDEVVEAVLAKVGHTWDIDTERLREGLPIIRYLPGAPPVGKHGDEDRHGSVPNATLVLYLTESTGGASGQTIFPEADVTVTPRPGSILSFQNVDSSGKPHPKGKHLVSAVPKEAKSDRLVVQIPIAHKRGVRAYAYPEHVSGGKKPGQHEKMHGNADQKAAYAAAVAAGTSIAVAFMAAKAGKFEEADIPSLEAAAKETGKFAEPDDFAPGGAK